MIGQKKVCEADVNGVRIVEYEYELLQFGSKNSYFGGKWYSELRFKFVFVIRSTNDPPGETIGGPKSYRKMAKSSRRISESFDMAWIPEHLMSETLRNCVAWAQHVKQLIMLTAGIETKKQKDMNKGELQMFMATEYSNWLEILEQKYPQARVHNWLEYTTGTRTTKVSGDYLYRNFSQGLREFHKANPIWNRTLAEGVSGKSKEEVWARFCYNLLCHRMGNVPEDKIPSSFDYERFEKGK